MLIKIPKELGLEIIRESLAPLVKATSTCGMCGGPCDGTRRLSGNLCCKDCFSDSKYCQTCGAWFIKHEDFHKDVPVKQPILLPAQLTPKKKKCALCNDELEENEGITIHTGLICSVCFGA